MAFFNKKEEVIDLQLTQYGKNLLSKGEFKPVSYAFFDDNVLYDSTYAGIDSETQNDIEPRIQENTPSFKTQYIYYGAETEIMRIAEEIRGSNGAVPAMQPVADKLYALSAPLGTGALHTTNLPAWQVRFFGAELSGSVQYVTGAHPTMKIPQLRSNIVYKTTVYDPNSTAPEDPTGKFPEGPPITSNAEYNMVSSTFSDGTYFVTTGDQLLIEIDEKNTDFFKENFDIEVFLVEEVDVSGSYMTPNISKTDKMELLKPLNFTIEPPVVVDNLLIEPSVQNSRDLNPDDTEYYFNINVDSEIPPETLCAIIQRLKSEGRDLGYLDSYDLVCPDIAPAPFDLYGSSVTTEDIEECQD